MTITAEFSDGSTWRGEAGNGWVNVETGERMTDQEYEAKRQAECPKGWATTEG